MAAVCRRQSHSSLPSFGSKPLHLADHIAHEAMDRAKDGSIAGYRFNPEIAAFEPRDIRWSLVASYPEKIKIMKAKI